jgi:hypothetical protein
MEMGGCLCRCTTDETLPPPPPTFRSAAELPRINIQPFRQLLLASCDHNFTGHRVVQNGHKESSNVRWVL